MLAFIMSLAAATWTTAAGANDFPKIYNTEPAASGSPMAAADAAAGMRVPPGFHVGVFAAEPDVQNPISMAWDGRGRLWVAENYTYAERPKRFETALRDRIIIMADTNGDGRSDRRQVFTDDVQMLTSIELGRGGVWAMCPPQLLFIPDRNGDDRPDGPAEVVLDGFDVPPDNAHNFANGLHWGPDGWLYGRCGASCPGRVGMPGSKDELRVPLTGGIWRYHPRSKRFEVLCHGTTNPWGHDWNEHGEGFFVNTVNGHLWHMIPGAHFRRPHTIDPNPRAYEPLEMHADHWHWDTGTSWMDSRKATGEHDRLGGGHAHSGTMIYLADQWPEAYRGRLMTLNLHGRRTNVERLERHGSGYLARHEPDIMQAADTWYRGLELGYAPDGSVLALDWSDAGECHETTGVHRTSGRIYRVSYGQPAAAGPIALAKLSPEQLADLHTHRNQWFVRQARRELLDRAISLRDTDPAKEKLEKQLNTSDNIVHRLNALWTLYALGAAHRGVLEPLMADDNEHVRTWAVRLLTDAWPLDTVYGPSPSTLKSVNQRTLKLLVFQAKDERSGLVRLALASTLQRLPVADRTRLAAPLLAHAEDAADQNLPLLIWYGLIPVADADAGQLVSLAAESKIGLVRRMIGRRLAEDLARRPEPINQLLTATIPSVNSLADVLVGMSEGLAGWRKAPQPAAWPQVQAAVKASSNQDLARRVRDLSVLFGDGRALDEVRAIALDAGADMAQRRVALEALIEARPADLRKICEKLLDVRFLNSVAVRGLALFDDPAIGVKLAGSYRKFHQTERPPVLETLVSRPAFARAMLEEMAAGKIARADLSAFQARQIRSFGDAKLSARLGEVWGQLRDSPADKREQITRLKTRLTPDYLDQADRSRGRQVFSTVCASCHRLFGSGAQIGPDLTGANRQNLDYLLSNILDPSAAVAADFRMSVVALDDGRVLNGIVVAQTPHTITLQTAKERIALERSDIEALEPSTASLMPDGLLQPLAETQVRDLFSYLMSPSQVPLPPE
ncbi:MAG TPA: PVC-type heme-binding CxxCH protein, partial [Pirellulales bacterium]|nr:PVC-type heme-binding CxxCH protein [Pirellulales bacterium]